MKPLLIVMLMAAMAGSALSQVTCNGLNFNTADCGLGGGSFGLIQGVCYQGAISVNNPTGSYSWSSTKISCSGNECAWSCFSDPACATAANECSTGYTTITCNCVNLNFSWMIRIDGYQIFSWQGNFSSADAGARAGALPRVVPALDAFSGAAAATA
jgi:hypothetical protein